MEPMLQSESLLSPCATCRGAQRPVGHRRSGLIAIDAVADRATSCTKQLLRLWCEGPYFEAVTRWLCEAMDADSAELLDAVTGLRLGAHARAPAAVASDRSERERGPSTLQVTLPAAGAIGRVGRCPGSRPFDFEERALLDRLGPPLEMNLTAVRGLTGRGLDPASLTEFVDMHSEPAALLWGRGILYANVSARTHPCCESAWLGSARRILIADSGGEPMYLALAAAGCRIGVGRPGRP